MKYIKIITLTMGLVILSVLAFVGVASAQNFKTGNIVTVPMGETVDSMLFAGGKTIDIAGEVNGDVYCAGQGITISGTVRGDVICAGQIITISGNIEGSVRLAGQTVTLSGTIGDSATVATQSLTIENKGSVGLDLLGGSQTTMINGEVKRDIVAGSNNLTVTGRVGRNIKGGMETIAIGTTGLIGGDLEYTGTNDPSINTGGKIVGTVTRTAPKEQPATTNYYAPFVFAFGWFVYVLIAMLVLALVLVGLFPRTFQEASLNAIKKPGLTALVGATSAIIIVPTLVTVSFLTIIGIPLGIFIALLWIIIMMLSGPFAGYLLGRLMISKSKQPVLIMLLGGSVLVITFFIPILGYLTLLASHIFGAGIVLMQCKQLPSISGKKL